MVNGLTSNSNVPIMLYYQADGSIKWEIQVQTPGNTYSSFQDCVFKPDGSQIASVISMTKDLLLFDSSTGSLVK